MTLDDAKQMQDKLTFVDQRALSDAYKITSVMTRCQDAKPNKRQREAKWFIYEKVVKPYYDSLKMEVPPSLEPDYREGWEPYPPCACDKCLNKIN